MLLDEYRDVARLLMDPARQNDPALKERLRVVVEKLKLLGVDLRPALVGGHVLGLDDRVHLAPDGGRAAKAGEPVDPAVVYPTVDDGVAGVAFVDACVRSSARNGAWVGLNL